MLNAEDNSKIVRLSSPSGFNTENGVLEEVNLGIGEAVLKGGQIKSFNIINHGMVSFFRHYLLMEAEGVAIELDLNWDQFTDIKMLEREYGEISYWFE